MKKKQIMACLLAGVLLTQTALLGACGSTGQETVPPVQTQQNQTETDAGQNGQETNGTQQTDQSEAEETKSPQQAQEEMQDGVNGFAFRFTAALLSKKEKGENLITSPYSVWLPLAALVNASDDAAKAELLSALGKAGVSQEELNAAVKAANAALTQEERAAMMKENGQEYISPLKIANAVFVGKDENVKQEFAGLFAQNYAGKLFSVDFTDPSAADEVNAWASEQTEGKITDIIDSFDPQTVAAIANAIYFSDAWSTEFSEEDTGDDLFHGAVTDETVPFMNHKFTETRYYEDENMQAVILNTMNNGEMILCLPREGKNAEEILAGMDAEKLSKLQQGELSTVQLSLPKFKLESGVFSVKEAMELMGVPLTDAGNPHIDGLVEGDPLYISEAVQKAMIEVDEKGLTAAAVTVMGLDRMSMPIETEPVEMKCDRPFAFVLTGDGGEAGSQVLFTGVVNRIAEIAVCE